MPGNGVRIGTESIRTTTRLIRGGQVLRKSFNALNQANIECNVAVRGTLLRIAAVQLVVTGPISANVTAAAVFVCVSSRIDHQFFVIYSALPISLRIIHNYAE